MIVDDNISLEAHFDEMVRLNAWLETASRRAGLDATVSSDLKLCLNEIVANLLSYAFEGTAHPEIIVNLHLEPGVAKATIWDNGAFFDLRSWPPPQKPTDLMNASIGGYGILLVRERARSIDYARIGTRNRLDITCSPAAPGAAPLGT